MREFIHGTNWKDTPAQSERASKGYTPYTTSAFAEHSMKTGHDIGWESAKVLRVIDQYFQRLKLGILDCIAKQ